MAGVPGAGVECPHCNSTLNEVKETRPFEKYTMRRRRCFSCKKNFTTKEIPEATKVTFAIDEKAKAKLKRLIFNCQHAAGQLEDYIEDLNK